MMHSIGQNYVDVMGELWEFFDFIKEPLPFALSKVSPLRGHGVTMKQLLFEVIFCIFSSLQVIDFINIKKLFLESPSATLRTKNLVEGLSANGWGVGGVK